MKEITDIKDDEIRVIRHEVQQTGKDGRRMWKYCVWGGAVLAFVVLGWWLLGQKNSNGAADFRKDMSDGQAQEYRVKNAVDSSKQGYTEVKDSVVNDVALRIYRPLNAEPTLQVGALDRRDTSIVYATQAADIRADNQKIVGAFVLKGEPLAWGKAKKGYCAIIDGQVTLGMAENTSLFEEATQREGYFFRQYALVSEGHLIENRPKGKAIRRALCEWSGEIVVIESLTRESFYDFAQALVDFGVEHAIYLVGTDVTYGWYVNEDNKQIGFGNPWEILPVNVNYIVWRRK